MNHGLKHPKEVSKLNLSKVLNEPIHSQETILPIIKNGSDGSYPVFQRTFDMTAEKQKQKINDMTKKEPTQSHTYIIEDRQSDNNISNIIIKDSHSNLTKSFRGTNASQRDKAPPPQHKRGNSKTGKMQSPSK